MYWQDVDQTVNSSSESVSEADFFDPASYEPIYIAPPPESLGRRFFRIIGEMLSAGARGILLAVLLIYFVAQAHIVYGQSMEPTLHSNQRLIVEKVSYRLTTPQRGDVVIIDLANGRDRLIKRVIGLAGEKIEIRQNQLLINDLPLNETYLPFPVPQANFGPVEVPPNHVFVLGDNRNNSNDSRYFGAVDLSQITGRAWVSYWPAEDLGFVD